MASDINDFKKRINRTTGYSESAINAAWPEWWSKEAEDSPSAEAALRFSVARKLGLDPRSLQDDTGPRFMWDDSAKYKRFQGDEIEHRAITSFGTSISRILSKGIFTRKSIVGYSAATIRESILQNSTFVRLQDLVGLLWSVGIPIIHLRVHPLAAKHMSAMAVSVNNDFAVLMAKDTQYPAPMAFNVAHEIGHICLGHINSDSALVDMEDSLDGTKDDKDNEEIASDRFAIELLTGSPDFSLKIQGSGSNPEELAKQVLALAPELRIEPGTLALCYGYATNNWATVQNSLKIIYSQPAPAWMFINKTAKSQLNWDEIGDDNSSFLQAVMGAV